MQEKKKDKAIYAGSFDLLTNGHAWMIKKAMLLFPNLTVAVAMDPRKKYMFDNVQRTTHVQQAILKAMTEVGYIGGSCGDCEIDVTYINNQYLVDYASQPEIGANYLIRGVRNTRDFENERDMRNVNRDRQPEIETVFLMPPRELAEVSSSMVKSLMGIDGWQSLVSKYVPEFMVKAIEEKLYARDQMDFVNVTRERMARQG